MEREVGGGIGMGNTCKPMAVSFQCMTKSTTIKKNIYSLVAQMVKNLPVTQETQVRSLVRKDPLKEGMVTHFSILAWRIPWTEEPGGPQSMESQSWT